MSLKICPDCGKEVSTAADACPNCGNPFKIEPVVRETVVTPLREERESVPKWIIFPVIILALAVIGLLFFVFSRNNDTAGNENLSLDVAAERSNSSTTVVEPNQPPNIQQPIDIPPPSSPASTLPQTDNQQSVSPDTQTQVAENTTAGKVELEAKVADKNGRVSSVDKEKFYLLDKDLNEILQEANLQPIQNQNLINSFGLSVLNPGKFGDFNKKALDAINSHIKYDTLTSTGGKATLNNVEPKNYYLFGIHKVGKGFAVWNSTVNIQAGQNTLKIQPQRMTEITQE